MEQLSFLLQLDEKVSGPAKRAADALKQVDDVAKKTQKSLDFSDELKKVEHELSRLKADPKGFQQLVKAQKELSEQQSKLSGHSEGLLGGLLGKLGGASGIGGLVAGAAAAGEILGEGAIKVGELLVEGAEKVVDIFAEGFKRAIEEGSKLESLKLSYKLTLGEEGGNKALEDIKRFSKLSRFNEDEVANALIPLYHAGFNQKAARSAFAAAADLDAQNNRHGQGIGEYLDTFERIKLKGGIDERRLVQLGVDQKDFYKSLGKTLGVSSDVAKKRAEAGKIDPQLLLNTVYEGIEKRQGGQLGTGAIAASKTMEARLHKLGQLPDEYLKSIQESPAFGKLADKLGEVLEKLDPDSPTGARIIASLQTAFGRIVDFLDDLTTDDGLDKLGNTVATIATGLQTAVSLAIELAAAFKEAAAIADTLTKPLQMLIEYYDKLHPSTGNSELDKLLDLRSKGFVTPEQTTQAFANMSETQRTEAFRSMTPEQRKSVIGDFNAATVNHQTKNVTMAPTFNITVQGHPDAKYTAQDLTQELEQHYNNFVEKTAAEAGAQ